MQAWVLRRLITHPAFALVIQFQVAGSDRNSRDDTVTIGLGADQQDFQPVVGIAALVAQELRSLPAIVHKNVEIAVVIEIAYRGAAADARQEKIGAELVADVFKYAAAGVAKHEFRLRILCIGVIALDVV